VAEVIRLAASLAFLLALGVLPLGCTARAAPALDPATRTIHMEPEEVDAECRARGWRGVGFILGCYDVRDDVTVLPYPHRVGQGVYDEIQRHEACHRLGWGADHGARPAGCR